MCPPSTVNHVSTLFKSHALPRPRAPQIRPVASTSFRPFSFSLWEVALTSAQTCAEVCRNPGICGGTNGGTFWKSGGTSLHVPPTRAAQAGPLVLVGCLMTPAARHYPQRWPCLLTAPKRSELEKHRGSNYPCANLPGRTHNTPRWPQPFGGLPLFYRGHRGQTEKRP